MFKYETIWQYYATLLYCLLSLASMFECLCNCTINMDPLHMGILNSLEDIKVIAMAEKDS
jgi:hypothetical protein